MSEPQDIQAPIFSDEQLLFHLLNEIGIIQQLASTALGRLLPHALTVAQFALLNHSVRMGDGKTPAQLAEILQVTRGTMTSTLARLEKKRFIRVVPDPIDGRAKRIFLTDQGRAAREDAVKAALPLLSEAKLALSRDMVIGMLPDLRVLRSWLDQNRLA